ncbi:hypothetical protein AVEN_214315-1, partial [Araneus ventricosus]
HPWINGAPGLQPNGKEGPEHNRGELPCLDCHLDWTFFATSGYNPISPMEKKVLSIIGESCRVWNCHLDCSLPDSPFVSQYAPF